MTTHTVKFGPYETSEENRQKFDALQNAQKRLEEAKNELFSEGDLDNIRLDADHPQELELMIHEAMQDHAQDVAHYADAEARRVDGISNDDIYYTAMDLLSKQVQKWCDDNDIDLNFA